MRTSPNKGTHLLLIAIIISLCKNNLDFSRRFSIHCELFSMFNILGITAVIKVLCFCRVKWYSNYYIQWKIKYQHDRPIIIFSGLTSTVTTGLQANAHSGLFWIIYRITDTIGRSPLWPVTSGMQRPWRKNHRTDKGQRTWTHSPYIPWKNNREKFHDQSQERNLERFDRNTRRLPLGKQPHAKHQQ